MSGNARYPDVVFLIQLAAKLPSGMVVYSAVTGIRIAIVFCTLLAHLNLGDNDAFNVHNCRKGSLSSDDTMKSANM